MRALCLRAITAAIVSSALLEAQPPAAVNIYVRETTGIRRNRYPVNARVPMPRGALKDVRQARLIFGEAEIEAQVAAESTHADGSIQWLAVDFNPSIGPMETQTYRLEYGDGVKAPAASELAKQHRLRRGVYDPLTLQPAADPEGIWLRPQR